MTNQWCYNAKTGDIFSYAVFDDGTTDFPRGTFLVDYDSLVTGFDSRAEAVVYATKHGYCPSCDSMKTPVDEGKCFACGSVIEVRYTGKDGAE